MKILLRLAILVAALSLVTNMAFASCYQFICYDIIATQENGNTNSDFWQVCLNNNGTGYLFSDNDPGNTYSLYLFGGGPGWFNTDGSPQSGENPNFITSIGNPNWTTWIAHGANESGFLQPIGEGYMLTGEGVRIGNTRYTIQGEKVSCIKKQPL
jgi:hypothetical protein